MEGEASPEETTADGATIEDEAVVAAGVGVGAEVNEAARMPAMTCLARTVMNGYPCDSPAREECFIPVRVYGI